ncbi:MAG: hypothetical protein V4722_23375 [Bacteroidota bacterium]
MKQTIFVAAAALFLVSCAEQTTVTPDSDSIPADMKFAYTIEHRPDNWIPGDIKHVQNVLNSLKAWETGDIDNCVKAFGDSVALKFDGHETKLSNDSLKTFFKAGRNDIASVTVKMGDWESVISKDKKEEYVSLWYKEITTDKKGKTDSLDIMDDLKIKDGKIIELTQHQRRYGVKK